MRAICPSKTGLGILDLTGPRRLIAWHAGYAHKFVGELILETYETELETLAAWMESPDLRRVLLDKRATELGFLGIRKPLEKYGGHWFWAVVRIWKTCVTTTFWSGANKSRCANFDQRINFADFLVFHGNAACCPIAFKEIRFGVFSMDKNISPRFAKCLRLSLVC